LGKGRTVSPANPILGRWVWCPQGPEAPPLSPSPQLAYTCPMNDDQAGQPGETAEEYRVRMQAWKAEQDAKVKEKAEERGVLIVNTGDGKGKSTSGFGTAIRAAGHGQK